MLIRLVLLLVFLALIIGVIIALFKSGNIFSGPGNICEKTNWFIKGCKP